VLPAGSILSDAASGVGFVAAAIAVCGFMGQVGPALMRKEDQAVRAATVIGGLIGLAAAGMVIIGSMIQ